MQSEFWRQAARAAPGGWLVESRSGGGDVSVDEMALIIVVWGNLRSSLQEEGMVTLKA